MPLPSASETPLVFFMQQEKCGGLKTGCRFQLKQNKKGLIQKNEENKTSTLKTLNLMGLAEP